MNDTIKMIIMEELDISPSEFMARLYSDEISVEDSKIKSIALKCSGLNMSQIVSGYKNIVQPFNRGDDFYKGAQHLCGNGV